jgi:polycomb protein EED
MATMTTASSSSSASTKFSSARSALPEGFKCVGSAKEAHGQQIYCVAWSQDLYQDNEGKALQCFATCGGNVVSVYEVHEDDSAATKKANIVLRQGYVDPKEDEAFYACVFGGRSLGRPFGFGPLNSAEQEVVVLGTSSQEGSRKRPRDDEDGGRSTHTDKANGHDRLYQSLINTDMFDGPQLLCVAGTGAIIKVIDTCRRMLFATLSGHGDDIYDLRFSPIDEWILLSASKDESLRMWNVKTSTCVAIFAGHEGHRDCVLSLGWHPHGLQFASGGMDTTVKLWNVGEGTDVHAAIARSKSVTPKRWDERVDPKEKFRLVYEQMPIFSTDKVHTNYVDVVQYVGDLILSKDTNNMVVLWKPITTKTSRGSNIKTQQRLPNEVIALREFEVSHCDVWFIRFATDYQCQMLAVGNLIGDIKVFDIASRPTKKHFANLTNQYCASAIRMVAFNRDAKYLVAVSDDASVWLWEAVLNTKKQR